MKRMNVFLCFVAFALAVVSAFANKDKGDDVMGWRQIGGSVQSCEAIQACDNLPGELCKSQDQEHLFQMNATFCSTPLTRSSSN